MPLLAALYTLCFNLPALPALSCSATNAAPPPSTHLVLINDQRLVLLVEAAVQLMALDPVANIDVAQASGLRNLRARRRLACEGGRERA